MQPKRSDDKSSPFKPESKMVDRKRYVKTPLIFNNLSIWARKGCKKCFERGFVGEDKANGKLIGCRCVDYEDIRLPEGEVIVKPEESKQSEAGQAV